MSREWNTPEERKRNEERKEKRVAEGVKRKLIDIPQTTLSKIGSGAKKVIEELVIEKYGK